MVSLEIPGMILLAGRPVFPHDRGDRGRPMIGKFSPLPF